MAYSPTGPRNRTICPGCFREVGVSPKWNRRDGDPAEWKLAIHDTVKGTGVRCTNSGVIVHPNVVLAA